MRKGRGYVFNATNAAFLSDRMDNQDDIARAKRPSFPIRQLANSTTTVGLEY